MKRFHLPLTTAISAAILASSGCSSGNEWQTSENTKVCVDNEGKRVADDRCYTGTGYSGYRWYYISRGGYIPYYGYSAGGGSWSPDSTASGSYNVAPSSPPAGAVTRGGFGSIGGGGSAGGGEGAGE